MAERRLFDVKGREWVRVGPTHTEWAEWAWQLRDNPCMTPWRGELDEVEAHFGPLTWQQDIC